MKINLNFIEQATGPAQTTAEGSVLSTLEEEPEAAKSNHIFMGDCLIKQPKNTTFTMRNISKECVRFAWPTNIPQLKFLPAIGHLHAGCSKDISVTFLTDQPVTLVELSVPCKVVKITFQQGADKVSSVKL